MNKFETTITNAINYSVKTIESNEINISYYMPDEDNLHLLQGICNFEHLDLENINVDDETKIELLCICDSQREYLDLGFLHEDGEITFEKEFELQRIKIKDPTFVFNLYKENDDSWLAVSKNIKGNILSSEEQGLFNWDLMEGEYAWDVGFEDEKGPTIYLNKSKLGPIDDWISSDGLLWKHLVVPTALRKSICLYLQNKPKTGNKVEPWVERFDSFLQALGYGIDELPVGEDSDFHPAQLDIAIEITNKICQEGNSGTIANILRITDINLSEDDDD